MNRRTYLGLIGGAATTLAGCTTSAKSNQDESVSGTRVPDSEFFARIDRDTPDMITYFYVRINPTHDIHPDPDITVRADFLSAVKGRGNTSPWTGDGVTIEQVAPNSDGYWMRANDEGEWTISARGERITEDENGVYSEVVTNSVVVNTNLEVLDTTTDVIAER